MIKKSNETKNKTKMYEDLSTPTKIPQSVKKRDSSLKDFEVNSLPKSNKKLNWLKNLTNKYQNITEEKNIPNPNKIPNTEKDRFIDPPTLEKLWKIVNFININ